MSHSEQKETGLVHIGSIGLQRISNSLRITNKLIQSGKIESVLIGTQEWMLRNLDVCTFRNGDPIPEIQDAREWERAGVEGRPAWCYYDGDPENGKFYGRLYNWYAVSDSRGIAPIGWHIPSVADWVNLHQLLYAGRFTNEDTREMMARLSIGGKLKATGCIEERNGLWKSDNQGATNETGFSAVPGGRRSKSGKFKKISELCSWWLADEQSEKRAWSHELVFSTTLSTNMPATKGSGRHIRCIRSKAT